MKYCLNIVFCVLLFGITAHAQNRNLWNGQSPASHEKEFLIYSGFGLSGLRYAAEVGKSQNGLQPRIGMGFRFGLSKYWSTWSLLTGVETSLYSAKFKLDKLYTHSEIVDMEGEIFEFRNTLSQYEEKQHAILLQIPLMLHFQTDMLRSCEFYFAMGGKIATSINGKYRAKAAHIHNIGYHVASNSEFDTQQFMGFGTFTNRENTGTLKFNTAFFASAETGTKIPLKNTTLYLGVYIDYGLNNILNKTNSNFVEYNPRNPRNFMINSILQSSYTQTAAQKFVEKTIPLSAGIKVCVGFDLAHKSKPY